ncbi:phosphopantetheine-binding protein [Streptomyces sp. SCSIO 30461]|uniref:phosphopantetheine-binding protein n=1 Tax=Streptomyces sp. SCSIO 30461 TaxID=3118085 RepID=UPI0030D2E107
MHGAVQPGAPCYAVADAYEMPWLPYHRQRHMDHSFLLLAPEGADDAWTVVDAYDNDTPWGAVKPGAWTLTADQLAGLGEVELFRIAPGSRAGERPRLRVEHARMDDYLAAFDQGADREGVLHRLTGDAWLLARSRTLHALFVADAELDEETVRHLERWNQLVTHTYVAYRRVARGRPEPPGLVDRLAELLEADQNVFPATGAPTAPHAAAGLTRDAVTDSVAAQVAEVVAAVLGGDPGSLDAGTDLRTIEGFSSFRMVDIIESLEARLGVEFDSDDLVPENLRSDEGLCRVVRGAAPEPAEP